MGNSQAISTMLSMAMNGPYSRRLPTLGGTPSPLVGDHRTKEQKERDHQTALEKRQAKEERRRIRLGIK